METPPARCPRPRRLRTSGRTTWITSSHRCLGPHHCHSPACRLDQKLPNAADLIDPSIVFLGLTEGAILANTNTASSVIKQLGLLGVHIVIDDFGTGYSSLSQLAALDVDIHKIDKSQVANLEQSPLNESVHAIIALARAPDIRTVAEGIETNAHLALQRQIRAEEIQG